MDARLAAPLPAGPPAGCAADTADWTSYPGPMPAQAFRNFMNSQVRYDVTMCVSDLDTENKQVGISVSWTDARSGETLRHTILTNMRNR